MLDECNDCRIKDAEFKKKSVQVESLTKKHVELTMLMQSLASSIQEVDDECKRLKKIIDSNNARIEKSILADEARVLCKYALVKGHGIQFLANLFTGTGLCRGLKADSLSIMRKNLLSPEQVKAIENRQNGLTVAEMDGGELSHIRKEQSVLIAQNQKLLERVAELQLNLRASTRRRIEEADFVELDEEAVQRAVFIWHSVVKYRRMARLSEAFHFLKTHALEQRQIELGIRHHRGVRDDEDDQPQKEIPEVNPIDLINASKSKTQMTEETKSITQRFSTQRASLTVINKLQTQRLNSLAFGFWKLWGVHPKFWASRQPFCSACMEHHPSGRHTKYGQTRGDLRTMMEEADEMFASNYHGHVPGISRAGMGNANADGAGGLDPTAVYVSPYIATLPSMRGGGRR